MRIKSGIFLSFVLVIAVDGGPWPLEIENANHFVGIANIYLVQYIPLPTQIKAKLIEKTQMALHNSKKHILFNSVNGQSKLLS